MGFKFSFLCDLLSNLESNRIEKASTAARNNDPDIRAVSRWFARHEKRLRQQDTDQLAVLSCIFPEKLPDRVYWLQHTSLARVIGRCLLLGSSRREELERFRVSRGLDLGECVENVMRQAENEIPHGQEVTVEDIDAGLVRLASRCKFSGPRVRRQHTAVDVEECLGPLYLRLSSRDAKWLTRMVLKDYSPVVLPERFILRKIHFLLPPLLLFQDSLDSALKTLSSGRINHFLPHPEPSIARDLGVIALECLNPITGVKIGLPDYYKARSIKHCCQMVDQRRMSIERKYDGEYCQIHIDLSKHPNSIQIFSKSGKDSTMDRSGIHQVLRQSLGIGTRNCRFSRRCILEGELLVWSDKHGRIMDFHKLRKFISRSGTFIGTESDSRPQPYEHLMVVFFDILVLDDSVCLKSPHRERRLLLKDVIQVIDGRADIAEQQVLDFSRPGSQFRLERIFAKAIAQRWEGCVLKGCDDPYFSIFPNGTNGSFGRWIKLKKDYIPGLGDTVDLALIGAKYEPRDAGALKRIPKLLWTHFFIGGLANKDAVLQLGATPRFRVLDVIDRHCASLQNMQILNQFGEFKACDPMFGHDFNVEYANPSLPPMDVIFRTPFVVEMLGSGFEKPSGARYFALRFPRITKIHWDRTFEDAASFQELQSLADKARSVTGEDDSAEQEQWSKRVRLSNGESQYIVTRSQSVVSSATSSGLDAEDSNGIRPHKQNWTTRCMHSSQLDNEISNVQTDIPIFHGTEAASSSSNQSDMHSSPLVENANQSSRARKAPAPAAKSTTLAFIDLTEEAENVDSNGQIPIDTAPPRTHRQPSEDKTGHSNAAIPIPRKPQICLKSPLLSLPQYRSETSSLNENHINEMPTCFHTLHEFMQSLKSQYHITSQGMAIGLVLLDHNVSLGPELLNVIKSLSQSLKDQHDFPRAGKVFLLDPNILNLGTGPEDLGFCLRDTWENIGKVYFCACISWTTTAVTEKSPHYSTKCQVHSASSIGRDMTPRLAPILKRGTGTTIPSITVNFEKDELNCMGEFVSVNPLVCVNGHTYIS